MTHGTEQHLEHAEHAQHAALNPFDRQVAMTMAIVAAVLAGVTMLSHRGHNETLRLQAEANSIQTEAARLQTEANIHHTKASDQWAFYQAKNIRSHEFQALLMQTMFTPTREGTEAEQVQKAARRYWAAQVDKYEGKGYWAGKEDQLQGKKNTEARRRQEEGDLAKIMKEAK